MWVSKGKIATAVSNAMHGVNQTTPAAPKRWYNNDLFPLIPVIGSRAADKGNSKGWWFNWAFFRFWSMDSFGFEFSVVLDDHWGAGFVGKLPYVRWVACIPCPPKLGMWTHKYLWKKPKYQ